MIQAKSNNDDQLHFLDSHCVLQLLSAFNHHRVPQMNYSTVTRHCIGISALDKPKWYVFGVFVQPCVSIGSRCQKKHPTIFFCSTRQRPPNCGSIIYTRQWLYVYHNLTPTIWGILWPLSFTLGSACAGSRWSLQLLLSLNSAILQHLEGQRLITTSMNHLCCMLSCTCTCICITINIDYINCRL